MSNAALLPDGRLVVQGTKCRRCLGERLWVDFTGELQCIDCDPPQKVFMEKLLAKKAAAARQQRSIILLDNEEHEDEQRRIYTRETGKTS